MRVIHTIEHVEGVPEHVVRIYPPDSDYEFRIGRWPVTEEHTSLDAIWAGVFEASDCGRIFGATDIAVHSTDKEAFDAYCAEVEAI